MRKIRILLCVFVCLASGIITGCQSSLPTYTQEKVSESIVALCQREYTINPCVWRVGNTVWIYLPLSHLVNKDMQWDKDILKKINDVLIASSRVLLSMRPRPQFLTMVASDTKEVGIDYTVTLFVDDIVKFQLQAISRDEFLKRHSMQVTQNPQALKDEEGAHLVREEMTMRKFLAGQIGQRIQTQFSQESTSKEKFIINKINAGSRANTFLVEYDIQETKPTPDGPQEIKKAILKIIARVIKEYNFNDFVWLELVGPGENNVTTYSKLSLFDFLK